MIHVYQTAMGIYIGLTWLSQITSPIWGLLSGAVKSMNNYFNEENPRLRSISTRQIGHSHKERNKTFA
ncbi:MAG: hypothetical protein QXH66_06680, partial [Conexivisphaerales archaeon]